MAVITAPPAPPIDTGRKSGRGGDHFDRIEAIITDLVGQTRMEISARGIINVFKNTISLQSSDPGYKAHTRAFGLYVLCRQLHGGLTSSLIINERMGTDLLTPVKARFAIIDFYNLTEEFDLFTAMLSNFSNDDIVTHLLSGHTQYLISDKSPDFESYNMMFVLPYVNTRKVGFDISIADVVPKLDQKESAREYNTEEAENAHSKLKDRGKPAQILSKYEYRNLDMLVDTMLEQFTKQGHGFNYSLAPLINRVKAFFKEAYFHGKSDPFEDPEYLGRQFKMQLKVPANSMADICQRLLKVNLEDRFDGEHLKFAQGLIGMVQEFVSRAPAYLDDYRCQMDPEAQIAASQRLQNYANSLDLNKPMGSDDIIQAAQVMLDKFMSTGKGGGRGGGI